jgi:hypothetical protein
MPWPYIGVERRAELIKYLPIAGRVEGAAEVSKMLKLGVSPALFKRCSEVKALVQLDF